METDKLANSTAKVEWVFGKKQVNNYSNGR
jgi:hypothetical protein